MSVNKLYIPNIKTLNSTTQLLLIAILSAIMVFLPIVGLCLSLFFFKQNKFLALFVFFAFNFGWFYEPQLDLLRHYDNLIQLSGKSLFEIWTDPTTVNLGKEPYPILVKFLLSRISCGPNLFSAVACTIYTMLFIWGILGSLRFHYVQKMSLPAWIIFLCVVFTVEYYWFLGFRFWSGVFVFTGFYLRYTQTNNIKYLLLSSLCFCFHFSLLVLCLAAAINYFFKHKPKILYLLVIASFIARYANIALTTIIARLGILSGILKDEFRDEAHIKAAAEKAIFFAHKATNSIS